MNTHSPHAAIKLTHLSAKARAITTELAANPAFPEQEKPSMIGRLAKGAAVAAGVGAAGYGVGSYLRGRGILNRASATAPAVLRDGKIVSPFSTLTGNLAALKAGHAANMGSVAGLRQRFKLSAKTHPRIVEFLTKDEAEIARLKGQVPGGNALRGSGMGLVTGGWPAVIPGYQNGKDFEKAGVVYRKRDAALAGIGGVAGALAGGLAGGLAGRIANPKHHPISIPAGALAGGLAGEYGASRLIGKAQLKKAEREKK